MMTLKAGFQIVGILAIAGALGVISFMTSPLKSSDVSNRAPVREDAISILEARGLDGALWVDARSEEAYLSGTVPGALNLNLDNWEDNFSTILDRWRPGTTVIVFCDNPECDASGAVADRLRNEMGLEHVRVLDGGWAAWSRTGRMNS